MNVDIIQHIIREAVDGDRPVFAILEDADSDFSRRYRNQILDLIDCVLKSKGKGRVPWTRVSASKLKRIWLDFGKTGIIRDEKGLETIADELLTGIARLRATTELLNMPEETRVLLKKMGYDFTDKQWIKLHGWMVDYFKDENDDEFRTDCGFDRLNPLYPLLFNAKTAEDKAFCIDRILNVVHQRTDLAAIFVEGGTSTLDSIYRQGGYAAPGGVDQADSGVSFTIPDKMPIKAEAPPLDWLVPFLKTYGFKEMEGFCSTGERQFRLLIRKEFIDVTYNRQHKGVVVVDAFNKLLFKKIFFGSVPLNQLVDCFKKLRIFAK